MGFFSFKCSKSGKSIPAYPWAEREKKLSKVVLVTPMNKKYYGVYDGYGNIKNEVTGESVEIYTILGQETYDIKNPTKAREEVFSNTKLFTLNGIPLVRLNKFDHEETITKKDIVEYCHNHYLGKLIIDTFVIGSKMNEMTQRWKMEKYTNFKDINKKVKIVREDFYHNEDYSNLETSPSCPDQGFFYG